MKILTPLESIMGKIEGKISKEELFLLQKELINSYAAGFYTAHKKPNEKIIKRAVMGSDIYKILKNDRLEEWIKE
jgi:hypothetical protein